jgi:hypothetical protein
MGRNRSPGRHERHRNEAAVRDAPLRKGRIENPGYVKLRTIAEAMDFPPELWFEDALENVRDVPGVRPSWFVDRDDNLTLLDEEVVEALQDETVRGAAGGHAAPAAGEEDRAGDRTSVRRDERVELARA